MEWMEADWRGACGGSRCQSSSHATLTRVGDVDVRMLRRLEVGAEVIGHRTTEDHVSAMESGGARGAGLGALAYGYKVEGRGDGRAHVSILT